MVVRKLVKGDILPKEAFWACTCTNVTYVNPVIFYEVDKGMTHWEDIENNKKDIFLCLEREVNMGGGHNIGHR